jgi:hypothetical protein
MWQQMTIEEQEKLHNDCLQMWAEIHDRQVSAIEALLTGATLVEYLLEEFDATCIEELPLCLQPVAQCQGVSFWKNLWLNLPIGSYGTTI